MAGGTVLIADDDSAIRTVLNQAFARAGYAPRATGNAATLWRWVAQGEGDVVITDVVMPDENAFDLIPRIKKLRPDLPIIVMSAQNTLMTALRAAEKGAFEYLPKPFDLSQIVSIVGRALAEPGRRKERSAPEAETEELPLIGRSPAMQEIYRVLARLTRTDLTVMITGESGTGKELVARVLHDYAKRRNGPFVAINMAAIPRELIESELFGHEKGAFTGAQARTEGRFQQAEGGTLFLDEIGDMPMEAQTRLLRVLQEGEYTTVGGRTPIKTDVRIIAATHRELKTQIQQGLFREDLYYRLNVVPLRIPPLRERLEDVGDLVRHFLRVGGQGRSRPQVDRDGGHRAAEALPLAGQRARAREHGAPAGRAAPRGHADGRHRRGGAGRGRAAADGGGRQDAQGPLRADRALPGGALCQLRARAAAAGPLRPHAAARRAPAADGGAGGDARQPDPGRRAVGAQPQYAAQEDPRSRHPGVPHTGRVRAGGRTPCVGRGNWRKKEG